MKMFLWLVLLGACGCAQIPKGVVAVQGFDAQRYLGTWYEIARLDYYFERGLVNVSATYTLNPDGSLQVINRGFDPKQNEWKEGKGGRLNAECRNKPDPNSFVGGRPAMSGRGLPHSGTLSRSPAQGNSRQRPGVRWPSTARRAVH
jgi:lipocalin